MILLDRVIEFEEDALTAELTVRNDCLLGSETLVPAWAGIEYMAQAIGAYAGIRSKLAGQPISLGYLLGTRRYARQYNRHFGWHNTFRTDKKNYSG